MRVLVLSESPKERLRATSALDLREDVEVVVVETPREARRIVVAEDLDVLVIDGDLAPKGGFSFLYELRAEAELEGWTTPPALLMVGREQDRWLADWAGANASMMKPVDPFRLADAVHDLAAAEPAEHGARVSGSEAEDIAEAPDGTAGLAPQG